MSAGEGGDPDVVFGEGVVGALQFVAYLGVEQGRSFVDDHNAAGGEERGQPRFATPPLFVYALPNDTKVKDATISLLKFENWNFRPRSLGIFEDQASINRHDLVYAGKRFVIHAVQADWSRATTAAAVSP